MKKTTFFQKQFSACLCAAILCAACTPTDTAAPRGRYQNGVFIVNQGITSVSGSISFWDLDSSKVANNIYQKENEPLVEGIYTNSMYLHQGKAYICVDNAKKIIVADARSFRQVAQIAAETPRFLVAQGNKGYVSEWKSGFGDPAGGVAVLDLANNAITKRIPTGTNPEAMLLHNDKLYVANSGGNTVAVIDTRTETVAATLTLSDAPNSLARDANNDIWVLFGGKVVYGPPPAYAETVVSSSALVRYTPAGNGLTERLRLPMPRPGADKLLVDAAGTTLYYTFGGKVYAQPVAAPVLNATPFLNRDFYGIGISPAGDVFYGADAGNFASNGKVVRYRLPARTPIDSATVGLVPGSFAFAR